MSSISDSIRKYVDDPSVSDHYGKWGALTSTQRKMIRELCDACDMYERTADEFGLRLLGIGSSSLPAEGEIQMVEKKIRQAIESARCRKYYLRSDESMSFNHQKKAEKQCELMKTTILALCKQLPRKVEWDEILNHYICQGCGEICMEPQKYCYDCGQKLDWGIQNEKLLFPNCGANMEK